MTKQSESRAGDRFTKFASAFLGYLILVILFGAWVRITHSGAGCGAHWPTCHGEIIPLEQSAETIIEYTHRLTSGVLGILALVLVGWAWARQRTGRVFTAAAVTLVLIIFEGLIGAEIVLRELVADDDSVSRAIVIALHLANTLTLTAAASLTVWWSRDPAEPGVPLGPRALWLCVIALAALIVTSMTGAVTALGDTLFPVDPTLGDGLFQRVRDDVSAANHFLVRLRIVHPVIAVITALYLIVVTYVIRLKGASTTVARWAGIVFALVLTQTLIGVVNIALAAPGWMQIVHLLAAQVLWIAVVLMTAEVTRG